MPFATSIPHSLNQGAVMRSIRDEVGPPFLFLHDLVTPLFSWLSSLLGFRKAKWQIVAPPSPSDIDDIERRLQQKRSSNAIISSSLQEVEEKLRECNDRNRAMQDLSIDEPPSDRNTSQAHRHSLMCSIARMAATCQRGELPFQDLLSEIFSKAYQVLSAKNVKLVVLDACAAEELWVAGRDGGVRQPIGRGDNAGDLTADISPGGDKPLAMIVAHEGGTRFTPGDGEILRVGAREIAAAIKRESASMEMENSAMGLERGFVLGSDAIPPLLSLFGEASGSIDDVDGQSLSIETFGSQRPVGFLEEKLTWDFDVFSKTYEELEAYIVDVYKVSGLAKSFQISDGALRRFACNIRLSYHQNPFHNFLHGFSVFQVTYLLIKEASLSNFLSDTDLLAALTGALCHDVDHPGVSNDFLIHAQSPLAIIYNDLSVLENHHCRTTFEILYSEENGIFSSLTDSEKSSVRRAMVGAILATDMRYHSSYVSRFRTVADAYKDNPYQGVPFHREKEQDRQLLLDMIVHCADLSGQVLKQPLARAWGERVLTEFRNQSIIEEQQGMPVLPFMLGLDCPLKKATTQKNFLEFVVVPLWKTLVDVFPELKFLHEQLIENLHSYAAEEDALKKGALKQPD